MVGPINGIPSGLLFFRARFTYLNFYSICLHSYYFSCLISIVYCFHAQMYGRTLAPEFRISYRHTEYTCIFREGKYSLCTFAIVLLVKNKPIIIIVVYLNPHRRQIYQCNISKTYLLDTWILCIDYGRLLRGVDFRSVMLFTQFLIYYFINII